MSILDPFGKYETVKLRPEDELLICCARTDVNPEIRDKILSLIQNKVDWNYLLNLTSRHRLLPLLYHNLNSICPELVPEDILKELKDKFNANVCKNLMLTGELIKVLNLLESEGIIAIPYKGPVLAFLLYNNVSLREFGDLDIFINKSDVLLIHNLLNSNGYGSDFQLGKIKETYLKSQKNLVLVNKYSNFIIEFHWKLSGNFFSFPQVPEAILTTDLKEIFLNSKNISVFSHENMFLILSIHAAGHHWSRLNWICDIAEFIKINELNWNKIIKKADELKIKRITYINILLVKNVLGANIPEKILNEVRSDNLANKMSINIQKDIFSENLEYLNLLGWLYFHIRIREKLVDGITDAIKYASIPSIEELNIFKIPQKLYLLYYILRPFYLIKNYKLF